MDDDERTLAERYAELEWFSRLEERQRQEVLFAVTYHLQFRHGTDGHNRLNLIALLAGLLNQYEATIKARLSEAFMQHIVEAGMPITEGTYEAARAAAETAIGEAVGEG
jgi:predicted LPLAT superfamily acyltransferase